MGWGVEQAGGKCFCEEREGGATVLGESQSSELQPLL